MAKMDEYEFIRSQLCAAAHCVPACDPLCDTHARMYARMHARTHAHTQTTEIHMYMSSKQTLV